ncbi:PGRP and LysM peptidoglycan-binding domain-containing protein [Calderihabitans maritimus]|uniref:PGRP and LysM peptidoglycan-binding domain-containing protein n=1 Tax=Calderihabitans maritimus TaxID=1246530 RepID=UPI000B50FEC3|nr:peptidoglycan-binding protein [Calderihabitans maritimus]
MQYVVQPGDTLSSIARRFNISLALLIAANPQISDPDLIFPGQIINIPIGAPGVDFFPTLRRTSRGPAVRVLQLLLTRAGFDPGPIDGIFGPRTEAAVKAFQRQKGLPVTGVVDTNTWIALIRDAV